MQRSKIIEKLLALDRQIDNLDTFKVWGRVSAVKGLMLECRGLESFVSIGSLCKVLIKTLDPLVCEVVGFKDNIVLAMPYGSLEGVNAGAIVELDKEENDICPDLSWRGRIIDAFTKPLDNLGPLTYGIQYPLKPPVINTQIRNRLGPKIELGVRSIDTFVSCCYGQRMGIFAGSGVGKSVLISMLTKHAAADVKVIGLIGERSREVKEFIEEYLGEEGLKNAVIIVSTGDEPALTRKRAAYVTMTIAEYFRDQGLEVLCILDSLTRFAMAQREIGLAIGEPPTARGYTPSVFNELPKLLERAGPGADHTSITGLFTILVEGDDHNEPISDAARSVLDGHIVLERKIAERGRYPAVDILKSVSRAMPKCNTSAENRLVTHARSMASMYSDMAEMIRIGIYKSGSDPEVDQAIKYHGVLEKFLNQQPEEFTPMPESYRQLSEILDYLPPDAT